MRSEQNKDWTLMFETWTEQLRFTAEFRSGCQIPAVHLDKEVSKNPKFSPDLKIKVREEMNELFTCQFEGKLESIQKELNNLATNIEIYN